MTDLIEQIKNRFSESNVFSGFIFTENIVNVLVSLIKQYTYYKQLADKAINQIQEEALIHQFPDTDNNSTIIEKHYVDK